MEKPKPLNTAQKILRIAYDAKYNYIISLAKKAAKQEKKTVQVTASKVDYYTEEKLLREGFTVKPANNPNYNAFIIGWSND